MALGLSHAAGMRGQVFRCQDVGRQVDQIAREQTTGGIGIGLDETFAQRFSPGSLLPRRLVEELPVAGQVRRLLFSGFEFADWSQGQFSSFYPAAGKGPIVEADRTLCGHLYQHPGRLHGLGPLGGPPGDLAQGFQTHFLGLAQTNKKNPISLDPRAGNRKHGLGLAGEATLADESRQGGTAQLQSAGLFLQGFKVGLVVFLKNRVNQQVARRVCDACPGNGPTHEWNPPGLNESV